jgi:creatinine amidohydrolase/Fe(II)-dependent formamide hydrolase-like protein
MQYAAGEFAHELPPRARVYPFAYWLGLPPEQAARYLGPEVGIHANIDETSAMLAIDSDLCDMEHARDFSPDFGELRTSAYRWMWCTTGSTPGASSRE